MLAPALQTPWVADSPPPRRARWAAVAMDLGVGFLLSVALFLLAVAWLMARTGGGARDVGSGDATVAFALVMAAVPGWLGWLAFDLVVRGATPGQRRQRMAVTGPPARRALRLAVHPLGAPGWFWLAVVAEIAIIPAASILLGAVGLVVLAAGIASAVLILRRRGIRAVHDRIAATRLVTAPSEETP